MGAFLGNDGARAAEESGQGQERAYQQAGGIQTTAYQQAIDFLKSQGEKNDKALQPYQQGGANAFNLQGDLSGANGVDKQKAAYANFQDSPGQQYLREQSEKSLLRSAAATGNLGGAALKGALQKNAIGLASQDYQNQFNNLSTISAAGQNATNTGINSGNQLSGAGANLLVGKGNAFADSITNAAAARASGVTGAAQAKAAGATNAVGAIGSIFGNLAGGT